MSYKAWNICDDQQPQWVCTQCMDSGLSQLYSMCGDSATAQAIHRALMDQQMNNMGFESFVDQIVQHAYVIWQVCRGLIHRHLGRVREVKLIINPVGITSIIFLREVIIILNFSNSSEIQPAVYKTLAYLSYHVLLQWLDPNWIPNWKCAIPSSAQSNAPENMWVPMSVS
jgi:hypothetical protein